MTTWVRPRGGRERGPLALVGAWVAVMRSPRRFFRRAVASGDQVPGLTFAVSVTAVAAATRLTLDPSVRPVYGGRPVASALLAFLLVTLLLAPLSLHLVAAVQTLLLVPFASDRAGVSETVQVLAYATAPCAFAGVPADAVVVAAGAYGTVLLAVGVSVVHAVSLPRAAALAAVPAALVFGYAFQGFAAASSLAGV